MNDNEQHERNTKALGLLLLIVGIWILAGRFIHINFDAWLWPFWVIVPGGLLMALGLRTSEQGNDGLVTFGSIVAVTGIILFVQNITNQWQSWAYAWALIFPGSVGFGRYLWGKHSGDRSAVEHGKRTMGTALVMFLVFGFFFEGILGIGGFRLGSTSNIVFPVVLIAAGAALFVLSIRDDRHEHREPPVPPSAPPQPPVQKEDSPHDVTPQP